MRRSRTARCWTIGFAALGLGLLPGSAAATWLPGSPVSGAGASTPDIAIGARGDAAAAWNQAGQVAVATRPAGGSWSAPQVLGSAIGTTSPSVAVDGRGAALVAWTQVASGAQVDEVRSARHVPGALAWTTAGRITEPAATYGTRNADIALAADGTATAVLESDRSTSNAVLASTRPADGSWSDPQAISDITAFAGSPQVAVDDHGRAAAAWTADVGPVNGAVGAVRSAGGTWGDRQQLSKAGLNVTGTSVAIGSGGRAAVGWIGSDAGVNRAGAAVRPPAGPWDPAQAFSAADDASAGSVDVAVAQEETTVAWASNPTGNKALTRAATERPGAGWSVPQTVDPDDVGNVASRPSLAVGPDGAVTLAFVHRISAGASRVQAARRVAGGAFGAPVDVSGAAAPLAFAALDAASDAGGDVLVAWQTGTPPAGTVSAAADDRAGPLLEGLSVPAQATTGVETPLSVAPVDAFAKVNGVRWDLGDGSPQANGASITHTWTEANAHTLAAVSASDVLGHLSQAPFLVAVRSPVVPTTPTTPTTPTATETTPVPPPATTATTPVPPPGVPPGTTPTTATPPVVPPPARDTTRPTLSRLTLRGRRVSVRVSEAARLTVLVQRCARARGRTRCTTRRTLTARAARAGTVRVTVPRAVRRGTYRLAVSATDAAGNRSATTRRTVRLVR